MGVAAVQAGEGGRRQRLAGPLVDDAAGPQPDPRRPELPEAADAAQGGSGPVGTQGPQARDVELAVQGRPGDAVQAPDFSAGRPGTSSRPSRAVGVGNAAMVSPAITRVSPCSAAIPRVTAAARALPMRGEITAHAAAS